MRVFATAAAVAFAAMMAWSSSAGAVDVQINGFAFGCATPDGETRKPKFGDVGGMYFAGLPQGRRACLETIDRMIYSCGANTTFISHDLNNQYPACLKIFARQAERCARHFERQRHKCDIGSEFAPAPSSEAAAGPQVEPADRTMWALKRSNLRSGPGTDHAKMGLLDVGDAVQVTGETGNWLRIEAPGGGEAFVYGPLLTEEAPERVTQAIEEKPREPSNAVSRAKTVEAPIIPDQTTRERVADLLDRCRDMWTELGPHGAYGVDFSNDREAREFLSYYEEHDNAIAATIKQYIRTCVTVVKAVSESGRPCRELANEVNRSVGFTNHVTRNAERLLDRDSRLDDTQRRTLEDYLQTCVPAYAAVLEGRPLEPYQPEDQTAEVAESSDAGPLHGSITFSQEADGGYAWGIAWSFDSRAGALAEATDQCREYGGTGCEEAGWFENACGALAVGDGNGYGTGWGDTLAEARRDALAQCRVADCRVEVARCSQSQEAGGKGRQQEEDQVVTRELKIALEPQCTDIGAVWHKAKRSMSLLDPRELPSCWWEISEMPGCHVFGLYGLRPVAWSGGCSAGVATGPGELEGSVFRDDLLDGSEGAVASFKASGMINHGKKHGRWVFQFADSSGVATGEGSFQDGLRHGRWVYREPYGESVLDYDPTWIRQYPD